MLIKKLQSAVKQELLTREILVAAVFEIPGTKCLIYLITLTLPESCRQFHLFAFQKKKKKLAKAPNLPTKPHAASN